MTESEARRAADVLMPLFPACEVRRGVAVNGHPFWFVRTYGTPLNINTPADVARLIVGKIVTQDDSKQGGNHE